MDARATFSANGTWSAQAGVFNVRLNARKFNLVACGSPLGASASAPSQGAGNAIVDVFGNAWQTGGLNTLGALGNGGIATSSSPTLVVGGINWKKVAGQNNIATTLSATSFGLATNGNMYGWGLNTLGQIGNGAVANVSSPVAVVGGLKFVDFSYDTYETSFVFGLTGNGQVWAWGQNYGVLGNGASSVASSSPVQVVGGLTFRQAPNVGGIGSAATALCITTAGTLYGWGGNQDGQLGDGTSSGRSSPTLVVGGLTWNKVAAGWGFLNGHGWTLGIASNGNTYAWGYNANGELGTGGVTTVSSPTLVVGGLSFTQVFAFGNYGGVSGSSFGLTAAGKLYAWGLNASGELGIGNVTKQSSPVAVLGGLTFKTVVGYTSVANINLSVVGITTTGAAYAWGEQQVGELGNGTNTPCSSPTLVVGGLNWKAIWAIQPFQSSQPPSVYGITTSGTVYAWGYNAVGQLGIGNQNSQSSPVAVLGGIGANVQDAFWYDEVPVVPGTTYPITFGPNGVSFGEYVLGNEPVDQLTVIFNQ